MKLHYDKLKHEYYRPKDLLYKYKFINEDYEHMYSKEEANQFPLLNEKGLNLYLENDYLAPLVNKYKEVYTMFEHEFDDLDYIISEIKGSLSIEGVHSSKKKVNDLVNTKDGKDETEQNIINMHNSIKFIKENKITKENIRKLYSILTYNIDLAENTLDGEYYRLEGVEIGSVAEGVSSQHVSEMMDDLIDMCNRITTIRHDSKMTTSLIIMYTSIIHYQFVYIHPYYDRNGRMARLLCQWVNFNVNSSAKHIAVSEVISYDKKNYNNAIQDVRDSYLGIDVTYFINYMLHAQIKYMDTFLILEKIKFSLQDNLIVLSSSETNYIKMLYLSKLRNNKFGYRDFLELLKINDDVKSKQAIFKILNQLVEKGVLETSLGSDNKTRFYWLVFKVNYTQM